MLAPPILAYFPLLVCLLWALTTLILTNQVFKKPHSSLHSPLHTTLHTSAVLVWFPPMTVLMRAKGLGNSLVGVHGIVKTMCRGTLSCAGGGSFWGKKERAAKERKRSWNHWGWHIGRRDPHLLSTMGVAIGRGVGNDRVGHKELVRVLRVSLCAGIPRAVHDGLDLWWLAVGSWQLDVCIWSRFTSKKGSQGDCSSIMPIKTNSPAPSA